MDSLVPNGRKIVDSKQIRFMYRCAEKMLWPMELLYLVF
jgi:uncharacterized membrane-anchored protein